MRTAPPRARPSRLVAVGSLAAIAGMTEFARRATASPARGDRGHIRIVGTRGPGFSPMTVVPESDQLLFVTRLLPWGGTGTSFESATELRNAIVIEVIPPRGDVRSPAAASAARAGDVRSPAVLGIHGSADDRVSLASHESALAALRERGFAVTSRVFVNEDHYLLFTSRARVRRELGTFLDRVD